MQFHEYQSMKNHTIASQVLTADSIDNFLFHGDVLRPNKLHDHPEQLQMILSYLGDVLWIEQAWVAAGRPYYNIWPGMLEPLLGVPVDKIDGTSLRLPLSSLVLRFPSTYGQLRTILVSQRYDVITNAPTEWELHVTVDKLQPGTLPALQCSHKLTKHFPTYEEFAIEHELDADESPRFAELLAAAYTGLKILAAIALLGDNPDVIVPKPLSKDDALYEQTGDQELIEKAKRKGCFQFDVGKNIIVQPGVRRPHFAFRYMGKVPNLVRTLRPIKGCIVQRKLATSVPTGFMDEEE